MRLFSSLKQMFSSRPCTTGACEGVGKTLYTQQQVNELCEYWHTQVNRAKVLQRKECMEEFSEIRRNERHLAKNPCVAPPPAQGAVIKWTGTGNNVKKKSKTKIRRMVGGRFAETTKKRLVDGEKRRIAGLFIDECCIYERGEDITAEKLFEIYLWWCKLKRLPTICNANSFSKSIDKEKMTVVKAYRSPDTNNITIYRDFGVNDKTMKAYNDRNLPQIVREV